MATIQEAREYLLGIKKKLERPEGFYRENVAQWKVAAQHVATTTLLAARPESVEEGAWEKAVEAAVETVAVELTNEEAVGARIWMMREIEPSKPGLEPYPTAIPFEVIVDWVQAGMNGEEGGKRIRDGVGEIDRDPRTGGQKTARQIAWRVFHAVRLGTNPRLAVAIQQWMQTAGDPQVLQAMDSVQTAWEEFFTVKALDDFGRWVAKETLHT